MAKELRLPKAVRARAPLRIGLAGGGTDVAPYCDDFGGHVLNSTIDKYAYAVIEPSPNGQIEFIAADRGERWMGQATSSISPDDCPLALHRAVYNRIIAHYNDGDPIALRLTTSSDAPAGSGLGSSSTLVVALVAVFRELLSLPLGDYELAHLAYEIERIDAGLAGGMQDQYAASFGGFNFIEFYGRDRVIVNPLRVKRWIVNELEACSLLYFTGFSRESAQIIEDQREHTRRRDSSALDALHAVKREATVMKEAVLKGDFGLLARSLQDGWKAKKLTSTRVTNAHIDQVLDAALNSGATAAKVSGAGGGGFMFLLVDPPRRTDVAQTLLKFGGLVTNCHFTEPGVQAWRIN
ncbi:MAG: dehydrogenase [Betaproteobacteria bacterium]